MAAIPRTAVFVALAISLGACAATEATKERSIFIRDSATKEAYTRDLVSCDTYVKTNGASTAEQTGAVVAGLLLGGVGGAASMGSSYQKSQNRLFEECMFLSGYRLIALPETFDPKPTGDEAFPDFNRRKTALDVIENRQIAELIAWEDARIAENKQALERFLRTYPDGPFSQSAQKLIAELNKPKQPPAR